MTQCKRTCLAAAPRSAVDPCDSYLLGKNSFQAKTPQYFLGTGALTSQSSMELCH